MRETWQSYEFGMQIGQADSAFVPFPMGDSKRNVHWPCLKKEKETRKKHGERSREEKNMDLEQYEELAAEVGRAVCTSLVQCLC